VDTDLVAFLDSDVRAGPGWVEALAGHFADPTVALVAPRVAGDALRSTAAGRYAAARSPIDLGDHPALVAARTRVAYVPSAALVVRREAMVEVGGFDAGLRYGEDVDLVWRLAGAGWRVRYDPDVVVRHTEPEAWSALWRRRFRYGTSAAPLAERHPDDLYPLALYPLPAVTVGSLVGGRPLAAVASHAAAVGLLRRRLRSLPLPAQEPWSLAGSALWQTWLALGRWVAQFALPALVAAGIRGPARRRLALGALLASPPLVDWAGRGAPLDPLRYSAAWLADEAAYGLGVFYGCLRLRRARALRPHLVVAGVRTLRPGGAPGPRGCGPRGCGP